jgi:hypothetical protein
MAKPKNPSATSASAGDPPALRRHLAELDKSGVQPETKRRLEAALRESYAEPRPVSESRRHRLERERRRRIALGNMATAIAEANATARAAMEHERDRHFTEKHKALRALEVARAEIEGLRAQLAGMTGERDSEREIALGWERRYEDAQQEIETLRELAEEAMDELLSEDHAIVVKRDGHEFLEPPPNCEDIAKKLAAALGKPWPPYPDAPDDDDDDDDDDEDVDDGDAAVKPSTPEASR